MGYFTTTHVEIITMSKKNDTEGIESVPQPVTAKVNYIIVRAYDSWFIHDSKSRILDVKSYSPQDDDLTDEEILKKLRIKFSSVSRREDGAMLVAK